MEYVIFYKEKERRENKNRAIIAFRQAELTASFVWKHQDMMVSDAFPYWTEEEKKEALIQKYKNRMMKHVAASSGLKKNCKGGE